MLDQENQTKASEPPPSTNLPNENSNNTSSDNGGSNNTSTTSSNGKAKDNPSLSDHDYCSPNKNSNVSQQTSLVASHNTTDGPTQAMEFKSNGNKDLTKQQSNLNKTDSHASTSSSPSRSKTDLFDRNDGHDASDDSSSSSAISSDDDSDRDLVIAQDGSDQRKRSLAPKDTPSISKAKLGRRPQLRTEFDIGKKQPKGEPKQSPRVRRPRQNTSVTDKSQWITGEEQVDSALSEHLPETREKRQRKEVHDPEFSRLSSSEYSESDAESEQESEEYDDNDPEKPWCNCNKPDDGEFMISCDACQYWFHGACVGVVVALSARWQKEGKDWYCQDCRESIESGTPKSAIPRRVAKKPKKTSRTSGKRRVGRPRKSAVQTRETSARVSLRSARKMNNSLDSRMSSRKSSTKSTGSESFNEFEHPDRLKELIRERKKAFFLKHRLSEQIRAEKMKELNVGRRSAAASIGDSLDSLVSSTNSPNMNNLPINIKSEHKEKTKPNIVLQINTKRESSSESGSQRLVTAIVKKRKHSDSKDSSANDLFTADPLQVGKKVKQEIDPPPTPPAKVSSPSGLNDSLASNSSLKSMQKLVASEQSASRRKRKDSESNSTNGFLDALGPQQMINKIFETLQARKGKLEIQIEEARVQELAAEIQDNLAKAYKQGSPKCINKFRSLIYNLGDQKNELLVSNVLSGAIPPSKLVGMTHDEMASKELSKWRERENKHSIELIKRDAQLAAEEVIVKKTHKGEEVISASLNDSDTAAASAITNQDLPTTPTKTTTRLSPQKPRSPFQESSEDIIKKTAVDPLRPEAASSKPIKVEEKARDAPTTSFIDPLLSLVSADTTGNHGKHAYDMNCKICVPSLAKPTDDNETDAKIQANPEKTLDQPKRLRISVDTRLDPANLSRMRETLVKPTEKLEPSEEASSSKVESSPNADPAWQDGKAEKSADEDDEDDEELYDPETSTMPNRSRGEFEAPRDPDGSVCWSGGLTMQDVGKFDASAKPVSGHADFMRGKLSNTLSVCGRIAPDQVTSYIKKLKSTTKNQILLVQLHPLTENDKSNFDAFFDYLYARNRCAVINCSAHSQILKDFYILPIHEKSSIPEILKPINGPGLDRTVPNCLLGLLVKAKRPPSATGSAASYTPTPISQ